METREKTEYREKLLPRPKCPSCLVPLEIRERREVEPENQDDDETLWWCPKCCDEVYDEGAVYSKEALAAAMI